MKLEEYLLELKNCPDEKLTDELGVNDNWPILLNSSFEWILGHFQKTKHYKFVREISFGDLNAYRFYYVPGTIILQLIKGTLEYSFTENADVGEKHHNRQLMNYNLQINLHPYQGGNAEGGRKMKGVSSKRALAMVIEDIGKFAIKEKIPLCMPDSISSKSRKEKDYSGIVYYVPKL